MMPCRTETETVSRMEKAAPFDCCYSHQSVASPSLCLSGLTVDSLSAFCGVSMVQCAKLMLTIFFWILGFYCLTVLFIAKMSLVWNVLRSWYRHYAYAGEVEAIIIGRLPVQLSLNPLESKGNDSATSSNIMLVHWPLMCGLLHLVQRGGDWAGPQPAQAPFRCTHVTAKQPTHQQPVYQSPYCCIMVRCSVVLMWVLKG